MPDPNFQQGGRSTATYGKRSVEGKNLDTVSFHFDRLR